MNLAAAVQITDLQKTFELLMESPPVQVMFVVLVLALIALIWQASRMQQVAERIVTADEKHEERKDEHIQRLVTVIESLTQVVTSIPKVLEETREAADDNYLAMKEILERQGELFKTMTVSMTALSAKFVEHTQQVAEVHEETRQTFERELDVAIAEYTTIVAQQVGANITASNFLFPPDNDCRWRLYVLKSATDRQPKLYKLPLWNDNNFLDYLRAGGEVVRVIENASVSGWHAVIKAFGTEVPVKGWTPANAVKLEALPEAK
ncbi:MAG TPA: hypothetical protein VHO69_17870 [Phototrophicaceae bacterium]|nr:hypothetical protein [Phototrophicaceae bacterium]